MTDLPTIAMPTGAEDFFPTSRTDDRAPFHVRKTPPTRKKIGD